jgi:hypothetical protein
VDFVNVYKREPFVHEYMYLRSGVRPFENTFETYGTVLAQMREVYSDYLNDQLGEGRLRAYTSAMYEDTDLVQKIVLSVTDSVEYAQAMKGRPHLYKVLSGTTRRGGLCLHLREVGTGRQAVSDLRPEPDHRRLGMKPIRTPPMAELWGDVLGRKSLGVR